MILVDSNIPMYLVGEPHPHKTDAQRLLERLVLEHQRLVSDAEVLQEILHRYTAIDRRDAIQPAFEALYGVVDEVFPVTAEVVGRAREVVLATRGLSARDAVHVAVMQQHDVAEILSFDRGFDAVAGINRVSA
ncbi:MAG: type II toxin-antitoxin system VapC family toxin [bacterium]